ncbi:MAG: HD-GYP domain-containing protein [bacterium]
MQENDISDLRKIPLFSGISDDELDHIARIAKEKFCQKGDIIVQENTAADAFYIIKHGKIEITKEFKDGEEIVIAVEEDGNFFGEIALLDHGPRSATARVLEPTTLLEIAHTDYKDLLYKAPILTCRIMEELSTRLRRNGNLLIAHLQRKNQELSQAYCDTLNAIVNTLEARDPYIRDHTTRVTSMSKAIAHQMALGEEDIFLLEIGALLHDVGKIGIPDAILHKPGPLDDLEYNQIKEHSQKGKFILKDITYLEQAVPYVLYHHERFDGKGYPAHICGKEIPLAGRIIAVADSFDAMTSDRPYRKAMSFKKAITELENCAGKQFDPEVVREFVKIWESGTLTTILTGRKQE